MKIRAENIFYKDPGEPAPPVHTEIQKPKGHEIPKEAWIAMGVLAVAAIGLLVAGTGEHHTGELTTHLNHNDADADYENRFSESVKRASVDPKGTNGSALRAAAAPHEAGVDGKNEGFSAWKRFVYRENIGSDGLLYEYLDEVPPQSAGPDYIMHVGGPEAAHAILEAKPDAGAVLYQLRTLTDEESRSIEILNKVLSKSPNSIWEVRGTDADIEHLAEKFLRPDVVSSLPEEEKRSVMRALTYIQGQVQSVQYVLHGHELTSVRIANYGYLSPHQDETIDRVAILNIYGDRTYLAETYEGELILDKEGAMNGKTFVQVPQGTALIIDKYVVHIPGLSSMSGGNRLAVITIWEEKVK